MSEVGLRARTRRSVSAPDGGFALLSQVVGLTCFVLASVLYTPPPESPQNGYESTEQSANDPNKPDLPEDGVIVNQHVR